MGEPSMVDVINSLNKFGEPMTQRELDAIYKRYAEVNPVDAKTLKKLGYFTAEDRDDHSERNRPLVRQAPLGQRDSVSQQGSDSGS